MPDESEELLRRLSEELMVNLSSAFTRVAGDANVLRNLLASLSGSELREFVRIFREVSDEIETSRKKISSFAEDIDKRATRAIKDLRGEYDRAVASMKFFGEGFKFIEDAVNSFGATLYNRLFKGLDETKEKIDKVSQVGKKVKEETTKAQESLITIPASARFALEREREAELKTIQERILMTSQQDKTLLGSITEKAKDLKNEFEDLARVFAKSLMSFNLVAIAISGMLKKLDIEAMGYRVARVLEGVREGAWHLGKGIGTVVADIATTYHKSISEVEGLTRSLYSAVGVSWRGVEDIGKETQTMLEGIIITSARTTLSEKEIIDEMNKLGKVMERTSKQEGYSVLRWLEALSQIARNTKFNVEEFKNIIDVTRSGLGLFGLTMENNVALAVKFGTVLKETAGGKGLLSPEAMSMALRGVAGYEQRMLGDLGRFLFFMGELGKPIKDIGDLWNRILSASERYATGGALSLVGSAMGMYERLLGREGAKFVLFQEMGLRPELAPAWGRIYDSLSRILGEVKEKPGVAEAVMKFVKGEKLSPEEMKLLRENEINLKELTKVSKDYKDLINKSTDALTRIHDLIQAFFFQVFPRFMRSLVLILQGIGFFLTHPWSPDIAWKVISAGFGEFGVGVKAMMKIGGEAMAFLKDLIDPHPLLKQVWAEASGYKIATYETIARIISATPSLKEAVEKSGKPGVPVTSLPELQPLLESLGMTLPSVHPNYHIVAKKTQRGTIEVYVTEIRQTVATPGVAKEIVATGSR